MFNDIPNASDTHGASGLRVDARTNSSWRGRLGPVGLWSAELRRRDAAVEDAAARLEASDFTALWIPNAAGPGIWRDAERLVTATSRLTVATGVASIWGPDADAASDRFAALTRQHGDRLLAGFGVSSPASARAVGGTPTMPLADMAGFLDRLDRAESPVPSERRLLGALGPRMTALAARRTAGVHPYLVTADAVHATRQLVGDALVAPHLTVVLDADPQRARDVVRDNIGIFLTFPTYRANLQRLGFSEHDLSDGGSDRLIDAVSAHGSLERVASRVQEYLEAGADHVALQAVPGDPGALPTDEWTRLAFLATGDLG